MDKGRWKSEAYLLYVKRGRMGNLKAQQDTFGSRRRSIVGGGVQMDRLKMMTNAYFFPSQ